MSQSFNALVEQSIKQHWDLDALTDYKGATLQYKDVARKIEKVHIFFERIGLKKGDKIALCGRNSANWGVTFLAIVTYGAVAVPIQHEFKADNIHHIVNHSDSRLLFVGDRVWENLNEDAMPALRGILLMTDFSVIVSRKKELLHAREHLNELFGQKFPKNFRPEHIQYHKDEAEELMLINYTSGTTSASKGVMVPYRSIWSNIEMVKSALQMNAGDKLVSILPMAHTFGMAFEFLYEFTAGCHIYFLTRLPSPKLISQAFAEIKPNMIIAVPLVIEKIIKKNVLPKLESPVAQILLKLPLINTKVKEIIRQQVNDCFGNNFKQIITGGAPLNKGIERFLHSINFHYTVCYGMTECGPLITYEDWSRHKLYSCGRCVDRMEVKIDSPDPANRAGEIICRGTNVMLGYYKNPKATEQIIDKNGWLHTGDLATMDADGQIIIRGRSKNMLLGSNGQNIYPEEIESILNNMPMVSESIIIQKGNNLVALIYPDFEEAYANGMGEEQIQKAMDDNLTELNKLLPTYAKISRCKIFHEEFEKTAKKSIKRFLYQNA